MSHIQQQEQKNTTISAVIESAFRAYPLELQKGQPSVSAWEFLQQLQSVADQGNCAARTLYSLLPTHFTTRFFGQNDIPLDGILTNPDQIKRIRETTKERLDLFFKRLDEILNRDNLYNDNLMAINVAESRAEQRNWNPEHTSVPQNEMLKAFTDEIVSRFALSLAKIRARDYKSCEATR